MIAAESIPATSGNKTTLTFLCPHRRILARSLARLLARTHARAHSDAHLRERAHSDAKLKEPKNTAPLSLLISLPSLEHNNQQDG